jgi:pimeloyl-ACP methyl ester carboxylesterase
VLAATALPYRYKTDDNPDGDADDALIAHFEDVVKQDRLAFLEGFLQTWFGTGAQADANAARSSYALQIAAFASPKATLDCIGSISRTDFRGDLAKLTVPTLLIHGGSDMGVPWELTSKRSHDLIAASELVIIEGGPHGLVLTHAEEFNRALLDFLDR